MNEARPKILALIPARGGSKRVKNKNIRELGGKPLIVHTLEAAKKSKHINRVLVTTDSPAIAEVARAHGHDVPFLRPKELADDHSTEYDYYHHALNWLKENEDYEPDIIVNLYPTSPFRQTATIDRAIEKFLAHPEVDNLRSVKKVSEHPYKMWRIIGDYLEPLMPSLNPSVHTLSTQLLPETYIQNASIYIIRAEAFRRHRSTLGNRVLHFVMDADESVDINSEHDFMIAEAMLASQAREKKSR